MKNKGFTFIEIIVVLAVFMALTAAGVKLITGQSAKARDAKRKEALEALRIAFQEYFNDNGEYPDDVSFLNNCGDSFPGGYLSSVPCDPHGFAYKAVTGPDFNGGPNVWFRIYTQLEYLKDPSIEKLNLTNGATLDGKTYNYGVSSGNVTVGSTLPAFNCAGTPAPYPASCPDPSSFSGQCGVCGCALDQRVTNGPSGYYCCPNSGC